MIVQQGITEKLQSAFTPSHLDVINESHMHNV
ncbi:MAG: BolA family transcriptional regulator, partial [Alphaproteobacteria bacterium]